MPRLTHGVAPWAALGLLCSLSSMVNPYVMPLLVLVVGELKLLSARIERPVAWVVLPVFLAGLSIVAVVVWSVPIVVSGASSDFSRWLFLLATAGFPLVPPWIAFFGVALGQYLCFTAEGRNSLSRWLGVNAGLAFAAALPSLVLGLMPGIGPYRNAVVDGLIALPFYVVFCAGIGLYVGLHPSSVRTLSGTPKGL